MRVPHVELYVRPGRDIARLVEVAALKVGELVGQAQHREVMVLA